MKLASGEYQADYLSSFTPLISGVLFLSFVRKLRKQQLILKIL